MDVSKKEKVAFVAVRYGKEINGGAEMHCRMLAERLAGKYAVEVITTCVNDYVTGGNQYAPGDEILNGVLIHRFPVAPSDSTPWEYWFRRSKPPRRLRHLMYRIRILRLFADIFPVWTWRLHDDIEERKHHVFYSEEMNDFILAHKNSYKAIIALTADYGPFYFTAMLAGERMIGIPTMHNARASFRVSLTQAFPRISYMGFNTPEEEKLARNIFGKNLKDCGIISTGIDIPEPDDWESVKKRFSLPDRYIVYVGRIKRAKVGKLLSYYRSYRRYERKDIPALVMVGGSMEFIGLPEGVIFTGFVTDAQRRAILQHSSLLINSSKHESLSLVLLEALYDKVPALVNGHCNVLKGHAIRSGGAVKYYTNRFNFCRRLHEILHDRDMREEMIRRGKAYITENYDWEVIMRRLEKAIELVAGKLPAGQEIG
ncbi:MAG: glycosyltransferase family 4 protein [Bacteroidetes bacterium]|uniref:Glycosyltransferase family 4 protein n=1 Tax=Candidatus Cryptobacteroides excrementipullorum TaxID=2840761 RepID=A0A9D9NMG7_9BACT|nr:glycosyltransferase family 4 protein [Candidatus Cryptobacteroides excrementipullorum]